MLEVENLSKTFRRPGTEIREKPLNGVNCRIDNGDIVGLMGKSGEGKSTIARILCGTLKPDDGCAKFDGKLLLDSSRYDRRIGFGIQIIPQQPFSALDPKQRLGDAVIEPLLCHKIAKSKMDAEIMARQLFAEVRLDKDLFERLPSQISGGQAQRAAIARTLAVSPKLLIADEATSMLDMLTQAQIVEILCSLVKTKKISILFISHDPELLSAVCNRRYLLSGGVLHEVL